MHFFCHLLEVPGIVYIAGDSHSVTVVAKPVHRQWNQGGTCPNNNHMQGFTTNDNVS